MKNIDWEAILEDQQSVLREALLKDYAWALEGADSSPYTFLIFDLQERIGAIEQENYEQAYNLLVEEYGNGYIDEFLL